MTLKISSYLFLIITCIIFFQAYERVHSPYTLHCSQRPNNHTRTMPASRDHRTTPNPAGKKTNRVVRRYQTEPSNTRPSPRKASIRRNPPPVRLSSCPRSSLVYGGKNLPYSVTKGQLEQYFWITGVLCETMCYLNSTQDYFFFTSIFACLQIKCKIYMYT